MQATLAAPVSGSCTQTPISVQTSVVHASPSSQAAGSGNTQARGGSVVLVVVVDGGPVVLVVGVGRLLGGDGRVVVVTVAVLVVEVDGVVAAGQSGIGSWMHSFATQASLVQGSRSWQTRPTPGLQRPGRSSGFTQRSTPLHRSPSSQSSSDKHPSGGGGGAASRAGAYPSNMSARSGAANDRVRSIKAVPLRGGAWPLRHDRATFRVAAATRSRLRWGVTASPACAGDQHAHRVSAQAMRRRWGSAGLLAGLLLVGL